MRQTAMALDRIDKIDRIAGTGLPSLPNPVNLVRKAVRRISANSAALRDVSATLNTKRREPRPRLTAIACGEPSPRLKPDGLMRRRPAAATPSGLGAVASARTPRVARTRTRGEPHVDGTKTLRGFSRTMTLCEWSIHQSRGSLTRRHGDTEFLHDVRKGSCRMSDSSFLRGSVTPCETSPVSSLLRMSTKRRAAGVSLFVDRREADPLSCRTAGARSCRRGRENPKGEDARAAAGDAAGIGPGGVRVSSAAQRAVSRRRRFVFARSAETLRARRLCAEQQKELLK